MLDGLLTTIKANWAVIASAPWAFAAVTLVIIGVVWLGVSYIKGEQFKSLRGQLELSNARASEYERKLQGASPDEAKDKIEALQRQIEALKPKQRSLTAEQRQKMIDAAKGGARMGARVEIIYVQTSHETAVYANAIASALQEAGWTVQPDHLLSGTLRFERRGLTLAVLDANRPPEVAETLARALTSAGIDFSWEGGMREATARLYVDLAE